MRTDDLCASLTTLWAELIDGAAPDGGAFILNSGDAGLMRSLDRLSAAQASQAREDGATIAAHAQHVRDGLSLMNRWARGGGNPFADATWDTAWTIASVDETAWAETRDGLRDEAARWREVLGTPRPISRFELNGLIASLAHVAYHLGAIRQIAPAARGPREGTFAPS